ncbi:13828_t:CDS:2, partial [Dentiscutata heterogama]
MKIIDSRYVGSFFFLVLFGGVLFSFTTLSLSKFPSPVNDTFTGFQTWHPEIKNFDVETWFSMVLFTGILQLATGAFMLIWAFKYETILIFMFNGERTSTVLFNKIIGGFAIITSIVAFALIYLDAGKIWTPIGVVHNYAEVFMLLLLHQGGNLASSNNVIFYSLLYILVVEGTTILLGWPYDAFFFKFQGLAIDWALFIQFMRVYNLTKKNYIEGYISLPQHTSDDERESEEHDHRPNNVRPKKDCHLGHVSLLPLAAFWHIAGNVLNTIFVNEALPNYLFSFSYGFMFASFAFFVYLDTHLKPNKPNKPIFLPDSSTPSVVLVTIASVTLSLLSLRL